MLAGLPFEEEALRRAETKTVGSIRVPLPRPEDLVVMKAVAHRPRDLEDIRGILDADPGVDREAVRARVAEFSALLEAPEILRDLEEMLKGKP